MTAIKQVLAREILDSRGNPTIEAEVVTEKSVARAAVPSGASTGSHEAVELRDSGKRYHGLGVLTAVRNVSTTIQHRLKGMDAEEQETIDRALVALDGTENKKRLGANALLAASLAACRAGAMDKGIALHEHISSLAGTKPVLPVPAFNIINGGKHAGNKIDFQEYMMLPVGAKTMAEAVRIGAEVYHELKAVLHGRFGNSATNVGDEGGFAPPCTCVEEPFDLVEQAVEQAGYSRKVKLGIDAAANSFFRNNRYIVEGKEHSNGEMADMYARLTKDYPLISIEDPFHEEAFESFALLTKRLSRTAQIVGDDLLVTNPERIKKAVKKRACNALLLKVNQIGTVTEALQAASIARKAGWHVMVSHRSGETDDAFIADLAVGLGTGQIKAGAPCRGERLAKYNQLMRIEEQSKVRYSRWK